VDVVPYKTCSYDCIYCQLGRTTVKTIERKEWVPLEEILPHLERKLSSKPDYITLSGSGEPTLYSRLAELISAIKGMTEIPVAVLTNGSLLWQKAVREDLLQADLVIPSLDAGNESMFQAVNRPHPEISFERMLEGPIAFREEFQNPYWLEILLLDGHTAIDSELDDLVDCVNRIHPDRVQLNTVTRPPTEEFAIGVSRERMEEVSRRFHPAAEVIARFQGFEERDDLSANREDILTMLRRRPCSIGDIADGLGMHRNEVIKYVKDLTQQGLLDHSLTGGALYYTLKRTAEKAG
jgi:wyosine [tRNA(Phe)-imidazoG37] synthetase (radical SAM superfamily)